MGSRKHRSTINQLLRLQHAIEDSKLSRSQLHVLYVDFEIAYESVEHDKLQHTMRYLGIPEDAVKVVADLYGGDAHETPFKMISKTEHHNSEPLLVRRGLVQGDSLSPLLFILYLEPLLRWLKAGNKGYLHRLTDSDKQIRTSSAAYVDDLALVTESAVQLATQVALSGDWTVQKQASIQQARERIQALLHSPLTSGQQEEVLRSVVIGQLRCCTARQLAALRDHQVSLTGSGPLLADLINTQHGVISKLANAFRKPFPSALEGRHRTVVDKDTGEVSMRVYAVKD
ncbi:hypothetical protein CYMTET_38554 [Cymbomonas tetramitiformis]|uniref:Reverse transcriptase domain-containing protein n=1 Tax=Cymbomonas tetramitiformis TaxID=36881 RepID=A0AAE0F4U4_9CHLO|nr:hypothetical protein CYMTET_38554 [Cymbomonas tetramitiformis]